MSDFDKAIKARQAARSWVTKSDTKLNELLTKDPAVELEELQDAVDNFDKRLSNLDNAQENVEFEIALEDLEKDIEQACAFRENMRTNRIKAYKLLSAKLKNDSDNGIDDDVF